MLSKLKRLSATTFENLTYDLLSVMGLENAAWRTPGRDVGRDIEGVYFVTDLSGHRQPQKWYIECKKYKTSVDWPTVHKKLSYAEVHAADFLLIVTTSKLSPQAIDETNRWNDLPDRPKVRIWSGHKIVQILEQIPAIRIKYGLSSDPSADVAVSMLPLSTITRKFTQTAYNESVFQDTEIPTLEIAAAMADLSERRLSQIESFGVWHPDQSRCSDLYSWIDYCDRVDVSQFDRYALRALICVYRSMVKGTIIKLRSGTNGCVLITSNGERPLEDIQRADLKTIALWGNFEIEIQSTGISIVKRRHH